MQGGKEETMKKRESKEKLESHYRRMASKLAEIGLILQGTIAERTIKRDIGKNNDSEKVYGPYYQWTFKQDGKTVTVNLTSNQAELFQKAIDNNKKVEMTLREMRKLSREICETSVEGVKKRGTRK
jgi:predicted transcriptional regulator